MSVPYKRRNKPDAAKQPPPVEQTNQPSDDDEKKKKKRKITFLQRYSMKTLIIFVLISSTSYVLWLRNVEMENIPPGYGVPTPPIKNDLKLCFMIGMVIACLSIVTVFSKVIFGMRSKPNPPVNFVECYVCEDTVSNFDHHCDWTGTCVTRDTNWLYLFLCINVVIYCIAFLYNCQFFTARVMMIAAGEYRYNVTLVEDKDTLQWNHDEDKVKPRPFIVVQGLNDEIDGERIGVHQDILLFRGENKHGEKIKIVSRRWNLEYYESQIKPFLIFAGNFWIIMFAWFMYWIVNEIIRIMTFMHWGSCNKELRVLAIQQKRMEMAAAEAEDEKIRIATKEEEEKLRRQQSKKIREVAPPVERSETPPSGNEQELHSKAVAS